MTNIQLDIHDGSDTQDTLNQRNVTVDLRLYKVIAEGGIFKRGKLWKQGETIDLDEQTGARFVKNNELEEIEQ